MSQAVKDTLYLMGGIAGIAVFLTLSVFALVFLLERWANKKDEK